MFHVAVFGLEEYNRAKKVDKLASPIRKKIPKKEALKGRIELNVFELLFRVLTSRALKL